MPNVCAYYITFGKKDKDSNVGYIFRVKGFKDDALVKIFEHQADIIKLFFVLN
jgi:hypothetical protein